MNRSIMMLGTLISLNSMAYAEEPTWRELGAISLQKLKKMGEATKSLAQETYEDLKIISKETKNQVQEKLKQRQAEKIANKEITNDRESI